jgi:type I restriction enzyme S subunit
LGQVADILNGFAFKSNLFSPGEGKPLIRIRDIFNDHTAVGYIGEYDERYVVHADELLVGMDGDFNCARWHGPDALLNQRVCRITPRPESLHIDFLTFILPGYLQAIHDATSSITVTHLSSRDIARIPIPVPPIQEQRQLADIFRATALHNQNTLSYLYNARRTVERLRKSILSAACSAKLTADWRGPSILQNTDDASSLPTTWERVKLGDLALSIRGGSTEVPENDPTDFPILRSSSVRPFEVDFSDVRYLSASQSQREANYLHDGDLLITRLSGSLEYVGNCAIVNDLADQRIQYPDRLFCCRLHDGHNARFIELAFAGPELREQIEDASRSAAGHQRISISDLKSFHIALPPIDEQEEIARRASQLLSTAGALLDRSMMPIWLSGERHNLFLLRRSGAT